MKRIYVIMLIILMISANAFSVVVFDHHFYQKYKRNLGGQIKDADPIYLFFQETSTLLDATAGTSTASKAAILGVDRDLDYLNMSGWLHFTPVDSCADANEGTVYMDTDHKIYVHNGTSFLDITAGAGGNTLDASYDQGGAGIGRTIVADSGPIDVCNTDADTAFLLNLNASPSGSAPLGGMLVTCGSNSTQDALQIANSGSGYDVNGTGHTWYISKTGVSTFGGLSSNTTVDVNTNLNVTGVANLSGDVNVGDAAADSIRMNGYIVSDVYLDDGTGATPSLIFQDGSDHTAIFKKVDTGFLTCTTRSTDGFNILTGNLKVGNGTPSVSLNGADAYITGTFENAGGATFTGSVTASSTFGVTGDVTIDDQISGTFASNDEEIAITNTATDLTASALVTFIMAAQDNQAYILRLQQTPDGDADNDYLLLEDNAGDDKFSIEQGGTTTWTLDAGSKIAIDADTTANTGTAGLIDMDVESATNGFAVFDVNFELEDNATQSYVFKIDIDDDTTGGETLDIFNITGSGTSATSRLFVTSNILDNVHTATLGAGATFAVIDAYSTINTGTAGLFDIGAILSENGASVINIDVESEADGAGEIVNGIFVQMDDDADNADNEIRGIHVQGDGTDGIGLQHAITVSGANIDAGLYLQTGYLRIGTGSTPDIALGDDKLYVEGTIEGDSDTRFDSGKMVLGNGIDVNTAVNNRIVFQDGTDNFGFEITDNNTVSLVSQTGIKIFDLNDVNSVTDVNSLTGIYAQNLEFSDPCRVFISANGERVGFDFTTANVMTLVGATGVQTFDLNDVNNITEANSVTGIYAQGIDLSDPCQIKFSANGQELGFDFTSSTAKLVGGTVNLDLNDVNLVSVPFTSNSNFYITTVDVNSTEIKTLFSAPKVLVAATASSVIELLGITVLYDYATEAYANAANNMTVEYKSDASGPTATGTLSGTGLLDQTGDMVAKVLPVAVAATAKASMENQPLVLYMATADPNGGAGGNAAGVLRVKVEYALHPTGF